MSVARPSSNLRSKVEAKADPPAEKRGRGMTAGKAKTTEGFFDFASRREIVKARFPADRDAALRMTRTNRPRRGGEPGCRAEARRYVKGENRIRTHPRNPSQAPRVDNYPARLATAGEQAARRCSRKRFSMELRARARAARKCSRAGSRRPARTSNSPRAA